MKKARFKEIVSEYVSTPSEIGSLKKLANEYPFSQVLHLLLANSSKQANSIEFKPSLQNAAFHATDRSILKNLIENNLLPGEQKSKKSLVSISSNKVEDSKIEIQSSIEPPATNSDQLVADVLRNLEKLQKIKKEAAIWLESKSVSQTAKKEEPIKKIKRAATTNKKTTKPKGQSNIIDKFIKEEPRITKNATPVNKEQDMAKESGKMRDDLISESLAKIYVKQGKIEKAIDIYKKLIWKFPQKKALFAAEIKKLKKK